LLRAPGAAVLDSRLASLCKNPAQVSSGVWLVRLADDW
jgi:hypothetical protein